MRPLLIFIIIIIVISSAYYDLKKGTIPHSSNDNTPIHKEDNTLDTDHNSTTPLDIPYEEVKVEAGQTVYGIVQHINGGQLTQAPHQVVEDFELLNPKVSAHEIIIGHTYRFPIYTTIE